MRTIIKMALGAALLFGVPATTSAATRESPMWQPSGPTRLDQQPEYCTLSREFAAGDQRLIVQFRTTFSLSTYMATLASATALRDARQGKVEVALASTGATRAFDAQSGIVPDRKERFLNWYAHDFNLPALVRGDQYFRFASGKLAIELQWPGAGEAFRQLTRCHDATLAETGIDLAAARAAAIMPMPANFPGYWATNDDYPSAAMRARQEGQVGFLMTIGTDGAVAECRVVSSSGFSNLDDGTCPLVRRRAKFEPARDENGAAVTGYYLSRVTWKIPQ